MSLLNPSGSSYSPVIYPLAKGGEWINRYPTGPDVSNLQYYTTRPAISCQRRCRAQTLEIEIS